MDQWASSSNNVTSLLESPTSTPRTPAEPLPAAKRAALMADSQKKVFFLHDEAENSSLARQQTSDLAAELCARGIVPYYRNGPYTRDGTEACGFEDDDVYGRSWLGQTKTDRDNALLFLRNTVTRKGPFYGLIALGETSALGRVIASEHSLPISTYTHQSAGDSSHAYHIIFITPHVAYEFIVSTPTAWNTEIIFPYDTILHQLDDAINSRTKIFSVKRQTVDQLKTAKVMKRAAEVRLARRTEMERRARREYLINVLGVDPDEEPEPDRFCDEPVALDGDSGSSPYPTRAIGPPTDSGTTSSDDSPDKAYLANEGFKKPTTGKPRKKVSFKTPTHSRPSTPTPTSDTINVPVSAPSRSCAMRVSNYISDPAAEPVTPCNVDDLQPMIRWLKKKRSVRSSEEPRVDFPKGSILGKSYPGGGMAVDLCKMVVGPNGIKPVLDAVGKNRHVDKFLLGNNIIGDDGAEVVADFIRDNESSSNIHTFYLAGNSFTDKGISHIAEALVYNSYVSALWLKRNPLGPAGAVHIAEMLTHNTTLEVLDLVNTNIGDEGAQHIFSALSINRQTAIKHLYVESSGCTTATAQYAGDYLKTNPEQLRSLYFNISRLGDEGALALAEGLEELGDTLETLSLGSCQIGDDGAKAIAESLKGKENIVTLDLGYRKGTKELGEKGNDIGFEGAMAIGDALLVDNGDTITSLRSLDLSNNIMSYEELMWFVQTYIAPSDTLLSVRLRQAKGQKRNIEAEKLAKDVCKQNMERFLETVPFTEREERDLARIREALNPTHVKQVYSVYRGNM